MPNKTQLRHKKYQFRHYKYGNSNGVSRICLIIDFTEIYAITEVTSGHHLVNKGQSNLAKVDILG